MNYEEIRTKIDTGDIFLFSGKGFISAGIKLLTKSKWSHLGMALRLPEYDTVLIWESTTLNDLLDVETGKARKGVQLNLLSERIRTYDGKVGYRKLIAHKTPGMLKELLDFRKEVKNRPYEKSELELIRSAYDGYFGKNKENLSSLFCSELVAEAYQRMNLLSEALPSNEYTPKDFAENLKMKTGYLTSIVEIN
jgi:hypothetical protein